MNKLNHIAFIMDGNGRWGKKKNKGRNYGHLKGVDTVKKIVKSSIKFKIPILTFYGLSNFMLWQLAYTELFFLSKLWPDFNSTDLKKIIMKFKKIKRNFGAI